MSKSRFDRITGRLALVVSVLALVTAMGGTSYAAVKLAKNSVTSATVKNNSLTSADIKDRSLLAQDFAAGQLPAGPKGATGPAGPAGTARAWAYVTIPSVATAQVVAHGGATFTVTRSGSAGVFYIEGAGVTGQPALITPQATGPGAYTATYGVSTADDPTGIARLYAPGGTPADVPFLIVFP